MRKSILTLMVGAALALTHVSAFALTPLSETGMKTPAAQAGLNIAIEGSLAFKRIVQVFYNETDGIMGSSAAPHAVNLNEETQAASRKFSDITAHGGLLLKNLAEADLKSKLPSIAIDETTRINIINSDLDNGGNTNELSELPATYVDNYPIELKFTTLRTMKSVIEVESR